MMSKAGYVPSHRLVESPLRNVSIKLIDTERALNAGEKWSRTFDKTLKGMQ
jgi:hypothetical protein